MLPVSVVSELPAKYSLRSTVPLRRNWPRAPVTLPLTDRRLRDAS